MALLAVACGVVPSQTQGLAVGYRKGDVHMYSFHSSLDEVYYADVTDEPTLTDFTALETVTVQSVDSRGLADLSIALSRVVITKQYNGNTDTTTDVSVSPMEVRVAPDGRVVYIKDGMSYGSGSPAALGIGRGSGLISAVLPDRPVKVGDTWEKHYDQLNPYGSGAIHIVAKSKYLRNESFAGVNAAVVETASTGVIDYTVDVARLPTPPGETSPFYPGHGWDLLKGLAMKGDGSSDVTTWIDPRARLVLKSHSTGNAIVTTSFVAAAGQRVPAMLQPKTYNGAETIDFVSV